MGQLKIEAVETFLTQPGWARLIVVRVRTSQPGLEGLGCATFTQRHLAVQAAIDRHLRPWAVGRDPRNIEDIWQAAAVSGYWRSGPVLNSALGGLDMALWDIKGKLAGMPCYQLWGGPCRPAADVYVHADGLEPQAVADAARRHMADGFRYVRCQLGCYRGVEGARLRAPQGALPGEYYDPREKLRRIPALFEHLRERLGDDVELLHDVHERVEPADAVQLARALEPYRLFFLEDLLAPEHVDWLANVRSVCTTPIAMGELFTNPREITPLVAGRLIDFIRVHVSAIGGLTPALKLAHLCEAFGVRTAWHGPGDVSPVGMAANVHLDLACHNFGIQEWALRSEIEREMFPGLPEIRDGAAWPNDEPGLGIDFNEKLAAECPCDDADPTWTAARTPDGTIHRP
jgi:mannonate dehydratase